MIIAISPSATGENKTTEGESRAPQFFLAAHTDTLAPTVSLFSTPATFSCAADSAA